MPKVGLVLPVKFVGVKSASPKVMLVRICVEKGAFAFICVKNVMLACVCVEKGALALICVENVMLACVCLPAYALRRKCMPAYVC